jgi:hypothetical protein
MANRFSSQLSDPQRRLAEAVIQELGLDGFSIEFKADTSSLLFKASFKTVEVLTKLIEEKRWRDVRHLFRAVLASAPQHSIYRAENEWSRGEF